MHRTHLLRNNTAQVLQICGNGTMLRRLLSNLLQYTGIDISSGYCVSLSIRLLLIPACLLAAPRLSGTEAINAGHHTHAAVLRRRIVLWRLGRYTQLWEEAKSLQSRRSTQSSNAEFQNAYNKRRATKLAQEGAYSKATKALSSDGILPPSPEVLSGLIRRHPQEAPALDQAYEIPASMPAHLRVSEEAVVKCIRKFPLGSAAGGSGLCPNHLYELSKVHDFGHGSTFIKLEIVLQCL